MPKKTTDKIVPDSSSEGNTKTSLKKQCNPSKRWCLTLNNWTEKEYEELISALNSAKYRYIIGKEVGENETPHLQGYFDYTVKMRPSSLKLTHKRIHFEVAKGTDLQNYIYCSKDGDYVDNFERQWKIKNGLYKPKHIITDEQVNDCWWEKEILNLYLDHKKNYDDRTIYWVWSNKGKLGKTNFCKYLMTKYNFGFFMNAKTADIAYYANETMNEAYCINYTRSNEDKINYSALEMLKDGLIFSGKFESCAAIMDSPFIVCFANFEPEIKMLSEDRWKIINIDEKPIHKKLIKKII